MAQLAASLAIIFLFLLTLVLSISGVISTSFTIINKCDYTVWPGIVSNPGVAALCSTGFTLRKGESMTVAAPTSWAGYFWGRTLCSQDSAGYFSCVTGDCGSGKIECSGNGGLPPVTLAEFNLDGAGGLDFFDVSLVDGYNLPLLVMPQGRTGCTGVGCMANHNESCPSELQVWNANGNESVACMSACEVFGKPQYCCRAAYGTPDACKTACPRAYDYTSSNFICASADYTITFCPNSKTRHKSSTTTPRSPCINSNKSSQSKDIKVEISALVGIVASVLAIIAAIWGFYKCLYKCFYDRAPPQHGGN